MNNAKPLLLPLAASLAIAACDTGNSQAEQSSAAVKERRQARIEKAEASVAKPPRVNTYDIGENQLLVIHVPTRDAYGYVSERPCFVWRDGRLKNAALSCDKESSPTPKSTD